MVEKAFKWPSNKIIEELYEFGKNTLEALNLNRNMSCQELVVDVILENEGKSKKKLMALIKKAIHKRYKEDILKNMNPEKLERHFTSTRNWLKYKLKDDLVYKALHLKRNNDREKRERILKTPAMKIRNHKQKMKAREKARIIKRIKLAAMKLAKHLRRKKPL